MKKTTLWLLGGAATLILGSSIPIFSQNTTSSNGVDIKGLPASDVLGSEDIWDNPTFVGGVIDGGPSASSEY
jgi:hypothetical protein